MKRTPIIEFDGTRRGDTDLHCSFCKGHLGAVEYDRVLDVEYRTCLKCGHQWQKKYWNWLEERGR